jgi:putative ABC transport system permease protein
MLNPRLIYRNLLKIKGHALLNIAGLGISLACSFAMIIWIKNELGYDRQLPDADRIFRLTFETNNSGNRIHFARCNEEWVMKFPGYFPQIEQLVRLYPYRHTAIKAAESKFYSDRVFATDSNFFKVFNIRMVTGNPENALNGPFSAVISQSLARRCFGNADPVGKVFTMSGEYDTKMTPYTVKGVMIDSPASSHIHFDIITSFEKPGEMPEWAYIYLLLQPNTKPDQILKQFPEFLRENSMDSEQGKYEPFLQNIADIHLHSDKDREVEPNGSIAVVYMFILISIILLTISWTNYYNLNRARMLTLQKQVNLQLILGSNNKMLILQSLTESAIITLAAFAAAGFMLDIVSGYFNNLQGIKLLQNSISDLAAVRAWVLVIFLITILAGCLPMIGYLRKGKRALIQFREVKGSSKSKIHSYDILLTGQFILSILLMVSAITINRQNNHMLSLSFRDKGSDVLVFKRQNWEIRFKYETFRTRALQNPLVKAVTASIEEPSGETLDALQVESGEIGKGIDNTRLFVLAVEDNFLDFFGIPLIAGRNFSHYDPSRKGEDYILNGTAVKKLGWKPDEAIGKPFRIKFDVPDIFYGGTVTGVVKDFNFNTARQEIKPYVLFQKPIFYLCFLVKIDQSKRNEAVSYLKKIWEEVLPDYPFQYEFLGDTYRTAYNREIQEGQLTGIFSVLAVIIICLGILNITSLLVVRKTKEIGIHKVNGARQRDILSSLNLNVIKCFLVAFVIACPAGWYIMNKWLEGFVYRISISWWIFAAAGLAVFTVTVLTVSLQSLKAVRRNPVEALRYE